MTKEEIAVLGHAFFNGKTLQYLPGGSDVYLDWTLIECPAFNNLVTKWRIKPDEPKTITICTFVSERGACCRVKQDSRDYRSHIANGYWTHIKSLDQVVEVE